LAGPDSDTWQFGQRENLWQPSLGIFGLD